MLKILLATYWKPILITFAIIFGLGIYTGYKINSALHRSAASSSSIVLPGSQNSGSTEHNVSPPSVMPPTNSAASETGSPSSSDSAKYDHASFVGGPSGPPEIEAPISSELKTALTQDNKWSFRVEHSDVVLNADTGEVSIATHPVKLAGLVNIQQNKSKKITAADAHVYELNGNTAIKEVSVSGWAFKVSKEKGDSAIQWKSSLGFGTSVGDWKDWKPCLTYSPIRLWRLRPAGFIDTASNGGPGVQVQIWKPLYAGAFYGFKLTSDYPFDRSFRLAFTINH